MRPFVENFPFICILLTMFTSILCSGCKAKVAKWICYTNLFINFVLSFLTFRYCVATNGSYVYMMGRFPAPFGNEIRFGVVETLLTTCFSLIMLLSLIGGEKHVFHDVREDKINQFYVMMGLLFASIPAIVYTNDLFTAYVFVEINTLTSCAIVMLKDNKTTLVATVRYLIMSLLGSGLFLIGITILYGISGQLLMVPIKESVANLVSTSQYQVPLSMVICLFAIGMGVKSALYPFHSWLPDAHGSSTSSSSAVLSGIVLKAYIIILLKVIFRVIGFDIIVNSGVFNILFVFAVCAMTLGSVKAINERDIKRMIAYSSVAQIGYIYLGISLGNELGMAAAIFQILVHAFTKTMLFNTAGEFMDFADGSKQYKDLEGAARKNVFAGIAFAVGSLSMVGIPLFAGFAVKYYLGLAALQNQGKAIVALSVLVISTVLNAIYYIPALMVLWKKTDKTKQLSFLPKHFSVGYVISTFIFIVMNFVLGICSPYFINLISQGLKVFG